LVSAQAQTYLSRSELKKPLSEAVEKTLAEFVERCAVEKQKQLTTHMAEVMKAVDAAAKLTADETATMQEPSKKAVESALTAWKPQAVVAMRAYLSRSSDMAAKRLINVWKPDASGLNEPVENWTPPEQSADWLAALRKTLGEERFKAWSDADARARKKTDEEIHRYLERWVRESRGPMNEDLQAQIELMKAKLALNEGQVAALKKAAEGLLDRITETERQRAAGMLRPMPDEARRNITGRSYFYLRFDRPRGVAWEKQWEEAASQVLIAETIAQWQKTTVEERDKVEAELAEMVKPSEVYMRQQMEQTMLTEIDNLATELGLDKERQEKLKKLSEAAIEESLKLGRKQWLEQARNYSAMERQRMRANTYFGLNEEQQAPALPVWKDGLKELLTETERARMTTEKEQREQRSLIAISRACLAEMDRALMLNDAQRGKLEPLLRPLMEPLIEQRRQQYWSYSSQQLFQYAGKARPETVRAILDDVQWKRWQELAASSNSTPRAMPAMNGTQPEAPDMEAAISTHLYKMFLAERKKALDAMLPQVEEARRVLTLPEATVNRLNTAAKGAVEQSLGQWRQNTERYVRQTVQSATPKNILQLLTGTERVSFSRSNNDSSPQSAEVWQTALKDALTTSQLKQLETVARSRQDYRLRSMAAMTVAELNRRRRLSGEQCAKLEPHVQKVLAEYQPDLERYMSTNWFLQYYYAMVPVAGVPEKEMQGILTPQQWKLCKDRDLPDAMQYWEGIENNHKNRLKQGGNAGQIFINEGVMIDQ
ncbi:MAG: hypothetical protein Q8M07_20690, partial [Prosthecobacter sp.]|nr:hypothetical protein [Prosthecobacter sp.]